MLKVSGIIFLLNENQILTKSSNVLKYASRSLNNVFISKQKYHIPMLLIIKLIKRPYQCLQPSNFEVTKCKQLCRGNSIPTIPIKPLWSSFLGQSIELSTCKKFRAIIKPLACRQLWLFSRGGFVMPTNRIKNISTIQNRMFNIQLFRRVCTARN